MIVPNLPSRGGFHNGGGLGIGPDGRIYWSIGDNGNGTGANADLTSLCAKVGRADRLTGAAPNDNPFFDGTGPNNDYIWARGFRNPFSLAFNPKNGGLWLCVVGSINAGGTNPVSGPGYEQVFVVPRGAHGGWNQWENNQPAGYLAPAIAYRISGTTQVNLTASGAVRANGVVTFTTSSAHPFRPGAKVTIAGVAQSSFNGSFYVATRISSTQFTVVQAGSNQTSGGGTATTQSIGGCVTGGSFYDSTAFPAAYHGNFFFGDTNTGNMVRATLDETSTPTSVDLFVTPNLGNTGVVDSVTGPDGALYFALHSVNSAGKIQRVSYTGSAQNMIVQPTGINVVEGGSALFTVRLAQAPVSDVTVTVSRASGDEDLYVSSGATLTFTPANWATPQAVVISAAEDAGYDNDTALFEVSAAGLGSYSVSVNGIDNDEPFLRISTASLALSEGGSGTFSVSLARQPADNVTVNVARVSGDTDVNVTAGATLTFTPANWSVAQNVTVAATVDVDALADSASISISLDGEPTRYVNVSVTDTNPVAPVITSTPVVTTVVNQTYQYNVAATGNPSIAYSLTTAPSGMTINNSTGLISWTPPSAGTFTVTVRANNGVNPAATQTFSLVVNADAPPTASITNPANGSIISGSTAEFYGDGQDDSGTVKAEFLVDGVVAYTDINSSGHYHFGGTHFVFDTTPYTNGLHTLVIRVTDSIGQTGTSPAVEVYFANGIERWRQQKFTVSERSDSSVSGHAADTDGDGMNNLLEYFTDSDPKVAGLGRQPQSQVVTVAGSNYLALQFVRSKWATDVAFTLEAAGTLSGPWTTIDPNDAAYRISLSDDTPATGLQTYLVRDIVPFGNSPRFLRLRLNVP